MKKNNFQKISLIKLAKIDFKSRTKNSKINDFFRFYTCLMSFYIFIIISFIYIFIFKRIKHNNHKAILPKKNNNSKINQRKSNIDLNNEFFQIKEVANQINKKRLNFIQTISCGTGNVGVGNALIMLNNLINICEIIKCRNIITPDGLQDIIKNPIFYKQFNITIFPNSYKDKLQTDIFLKSDNAYYFRFRKRKYYMRINLIREEVLRNLPKYDISPSDLYIHIRSGDIFSGIHRNYAQPPLCFYQKIIDDGKFVKIFILSNGYENPVINELLKLYPKIQFKKDSIINDIAKIVKCYNIVLAISTFSRSLIELNKNLKRIYMYQFNYSNFKISYNAKIYKMIASTTYSNIMKGRWRNTKDQLNLMLSENCKNTSFIL